MSVLNTELVQFLQIVFDRKLLFTKQQSVNKVPKMYENEERHEGNMILIRLLTVFTVEIVKSSVRIVTTKGLDMNEVSLFTLTHLSELEFTFIFTFSLRKLKCKYKR